MHESPVFASSPSTITQGSWHLHLTDSVSPSPSSGLCAQQILGQTQQCASLLVLRTWLLQVWRTLPIFAQDLTKRSGKKQASHDLACLFFFDSSLRLNCGGRWGKGLSNRVQHQKWLQEMLDCWFLMHVG